jgi:hypothetical protein
MSRRWPRGSSSRDHLIGHQVQQRSRYGALGTALLSKDLREPLAVSWGCRQISISSGMTQIIPHGKNDNRHS